MLLLLLYMKTGHLADTTARLLQSMTAQPGNSLPRVVDFSPMRNKSSQQQQRKHRNNSTASTPTDGAKVPVLDAPGSANNVSREGVASRPLRVTRPRDKAASARIAHLSKHLGSLNFHE